MFLKSLTVRGFKSFADKTTLEFEPGVTVVVGPNGSGKSNLVDAVAWVLGAQGPRTLRGGKMDDVIFAGTADRPALGRAEVSLTIDNTSALLPIEFSEVTITRTLFREGDSEYQLNGAPCRLLDIQELLSDTGIGRQQHVIVGQGQLDAVLNARPEDRRGVDRGSRRHPEVPQAPRARRAPARVPPKATCCGSTTCSARCGASSRRSQRQADAARRHGGLVEELRAIRLHLAGHEIAGLQARIERLRDARAEHTQREGELRIRLRDLDVAVLDAERSLTVMGDDALADWLVRVESTRERARGLGALVAEKLRGVERELDAAADAGVLETLGGRRRCPADRARRARRCDRSRPTCRRPRRLGCGSRTARRRTKRGARRKPTPQAGAPVPTRSTSVSARPAPRPVPTSSWESMASSARWSTCSRSNRARKQPSPPRSAKRSAPSS